MGCPPTPLSCLDPTVLFSGMYNWRCGGFADPSNFQAERLVFKNLYIEQINNHGVEVNYYVNGFSLTDANMLYGEHPTQEYSGPFVIKAYLELEEAVSLSRFGMDSDDELTAYIAIDSFTNTFIDFLYTENDILMLTEDFREMSVDTIATKFFVDRGQRIEPKSDDLIEVTALGCDRPGNRGAKIFRITEVLDQDTGSGINPLLGHYVWKIKAKRYETSSETNAPQELGNDQVYDNNYSGKLSSVLFPTLTSPSKVYDFDVNTVSKNQVYDMDNTPNDIYGTYY